MLDLKEKILEAYAATTKLRNDLVGDGAKEYFAAAGTNRRPASTDFDIAQTRLRSFLKKELLSPAWVSVISGGAISDDHSVATLALMFGAVESPLQVPEPARDAKPKTGRLAVSAMVGAIVGMAILTPLFRLAFDMRDVGLVVGAPVGAMCAVFLSLRLSTSPFISRMVPHVFRVTERLPEYNRKSHERFVHSSIEQWLSQSVAVLAALCYSQSWKAEPVTDKESTFRRIAKLIYGLHGASGESLPVVADELIREARNCGFEGLEGPPAFLSSAESKETVLNWTEDLSSKYEPFGHIAEGDRVRVERQPVVFGGTIIERGLVRKLREKSQT
jgi:hypothetical protein